MHNDTSFCRLVVQLGLFLWMICAGQQPACYVAVFALPEPTCLYCSSAVSETVLPSYVSSSLAAGIACLTSCCGIWILWPLELFFHWVHTNALSNNFGLYTFTLVHCALTWTPVCLWKPSVVKVLFHCYFPCHFITAALYCTSAVDRFRPLLGLTALFYFVCSFTNQKTIIECFSACVCSSCFFSQRLIRSLSFISCLLKVPDTLFWTSTSHCTCKQSWEAWLLCQCALC